MRFLREHRSEWADFNVDAYSAASLKAGSYAYPGMRPTRFTGSQIIMPLGHTIEHEEVCFFFFFLFFSNGSCCLPSLFFLGGYIGMDIQFPAIRVGRDVFI